MTNTITDIRRRVDELDWDRLAGDLGRQGHAVTDTVLGEDECAALAGLFDSARFRSTVEMARHRFGDGRHRRAPRALPCRRADAAHAADPARRRRRLTSEPGAFVIFHDAR